MSDFSTSTNGAAVVVETVVMGLVSLVIDVADVIDGASVSLDIGCLGTIKPAYQAENNNAAQKHIKAHAMITMRGQPEQMPFELGL